jgi:CBS domain-containing protein
VKISDVLGTKGGAVVTVIGTNTVGEVVAKLAEHRIGAVAVVDKWQKLAGIFSERDLVRVLAQHGTSALQRAVQDVMTTSVITCGVEDRIDAMLDRMTMRKIRHLPVVDGTALIGIVSIGDLVHHRLREKELESSVLLDIARFHP